MPVHLEQATLAQMLAEVTAQREPLARRKAIALRVSVSEHMPTMYTDRTKLRQIILNLLSNAVKFTHRGWASVAATMDGSASQDDVRRSHTFEKGESRAFTPEILARQLSSTPYPAREKFDPGTRMPW